MLETGKKYLYITTSQNLKLISLIIRFSTVQKRVIKIHIVERPILYRVIEKDGRDLKPL